MDKIPGKLYVILLLSLFLININAGIRLEMRTTDGVANNTAVVGQPFLIEVIIDGMQGSVQAPHIEGLDKFFVKRTGMYMSSINGVSTTKYTYQVRIDQPGRYTIGPAKLIHQKQEFVSNTIPVIVENSQSLVNKSKNNKNDELKVFLRLMVDVDRVVVGQKINATLRFYYQDPSISLANLGQTDVTGFDIKPAGKPIGGTVDIKGVHYKFAEWHWEMFPTKAGEFLIPAYSADYEIPLKDNHLLGSFFMFMNNRTDRKRVYSNALKITVDPLPHSNLPVQAIGVFDNIHAQITPAVAKEGEGMVLSLEISGDGNMHAITTPVLDLPSALKYYDSNTTIINDDNNECAKKRFEFIVQGMETGDWEIPEQSFVYFDINKQDYVTLKTSSLSVSIQPSLFKTTLSVPSKNDVISETIVKEDTIAPLNVKGPWYPVATWKPIPWILFYCMLWIPMMFVLYPALCNWSLRFEIMKRRQRKKACKNARKQIIMYMKRNDNKFIYSVFIELFAFLNNQLSSSLESSTIDYYLVQLGFSDYDIKEWHIFFASAAHAAYAQSDKNKVHELCRMALQWIDRLEEVV